MIGRLAKEAKKSTARAAKQQAKNAAKNYGKVSRVAKNFAGEFADDIAEDVAEGLATRFTRAINDIPYRQMIDDRIRDSRTRQNYFNKIQRNFTENVTGGIPYQRTLVDKAQDVGSGIGKLFFTDHRRNGELVGRHIDNAFTGKRMRKWVAPTVVGGAIATGAALGQAEDRLWAGGDAPEVTFSEALQRRPKPGSSAEVEAPMMLADGRASLRTQADDLGTSGDMVLGMHNRKQGGYL